MKEEIILGLDPGTRITGYGIIQKIQNRPSVIKYGCITLPLEMSHSEKYYLLFQNIEDLLQTYQPDHVAVENQFAHQNVQSALKLAMAKAAAFIACGKVKTPIFEYPPTAIKAAVTGNGRASKEQVQKMVQTILKISLTIASHDASDALAIAICHLERFVKLSSLKMRGSAC